LVNEISLYYDARSKKHQYIYIYIYRVGRGKEKEKVDNKHNMVGGEVQMD